MRTRLALALVLPLSLAAAAFAAPPTDAQIDAAIKAIDTAKTPEGASPAEKREARKDAAAAALKDISLGEASLAQLDKLITNRIATITPDLTKSIDARLVELAKQTDANGAKAADLRLTIVPPTDRPSKDLSREEASKEYSKLEKARLTHLAELTDEALKHPGAKDMFASGGGGDVFRTIATIASANPTITKEHNFYEAIAPYVSDDLPADLVVSLSRISSPLVEARETLSPGTYDTLRTHLASASDAASARIAKEHAAKLALPKPAAPDPDDKDAVAKAKAAEMALATEERQITYLKDNATLLRGPYATGELLDHSAPAIAFDWTSGDKKIHDFSDLKGRIVLVDFWATWCGPCRAAFGGLRELQSRYAGYPVTILGVTSIQGKRNVNKANKPTHTEDNAAAERELMREFMKDLDMTWTVAYSSDSCFNPNFGVRGIPHIALIDSTGKVRYNGLRPNPKEESEHIDALLKEAKLPFPENPYVAPKKGGTDDDD